MDLTKVEAQAKAVLHAAELNRGIREGRDWRRTAEQLAQDTLSLIREVRQTEAAVSALSRLTAAALPVDLWLGSQRAHPLSESERKEFVDAFSVALISLPGYQPGEDVPL